MDLRLPEINNVALAGRLTRDAEIKDVGDSRVMNAGIAVSRSYKTRDGERKEDTVFAELEYWNPPDYVIQHAVKGFPVYVEGSFTQSVYEDNQGVTQRKTRIRVQRWQCIAWPEDESKPTQSKPQPEPEPEPEDSDDIPF